jgi:hypothetical protein
MGAQAALAMRANLRRFARSVAAPRGREQLEPVVAIGTADRMAFVGQLVHAVYPPTLQRQKTERELIPRPNRGMFGVYQAMMTGV